MSAPRRGKRLVLALAAALAAAAAGAQASAGPQAAAGSPADLSIGPADLRIVAREDGGYDLYVRKKPGLGSILLTETTKDPAMKADNFAYRAVDYNSVNGDEKRLLNGKALPPANKLYSLVSSTPVPDAALGSAFRILIPPILVYGYSWSRSGTVAVGKGTFINIRAFARPYADYSGAFRDNPYEIKIAAKPIPPTPPAPPPAPQPQRESPPPPADDRTSSKLDALIEAAPGKSLDLVVCLDTTESMVPYIDDLKKNLGPILRRRVSGFASFRIGIVLFRDYWPDDYITLKYPFTADIESFERTLKAVKVAGGRDIPEAEFEALYAAATEFDWKADRRQVILVTDAPPHPEQRGKIGFADVVEKAGALGLEADAIIEPASVAPPSPGHPDFENEAKLLGRRAAAGPQRLLVQAGSDALRDIVEKELAAEIEAQGGSLVFARDAGASCLLLVRELRLGALAERVSRLVDAESGAELGRDVLWTALRGDDGAASTKAAAAFVNGVRTR